MFVFQAFNIMEIKQLQLMKIKTNLIFIVIITKHSTIVVLLIIIFY